MHGIQKQWISMRRLKHLLVTAKLFAHQLSVESMWISEMDQGYSLITLLKIQTQS